MSRRTDRVDHLLRTELSLLISREMSDPRVSLATVVSVQTSSDLRHARVMISALGNDAARQASIAALNHAAGFLRGNLARRLQMRSTPELRFELDRGAEHSQRISELLENVDDHQ